MPNRRDFFFKGPDRETSASLAARSGGPQTADGAASTAVWGPPLRTGAGVSIRVFSLVS